MRICRFDDDRLGTVSNGLLHDITTIQRQIRANAPYTMKGDPVIKALPEYRNRLLAEAAKVPGISLSSIQLLAPVARPSKVMAAPSNYRSHIAEMETGKKNSKFIGNIAEDGVFLKANSAIVGQSEGVPIRFSERRTDDELELVVIMASKEQTSASTRRSITSPDIAWAWTWWSAGHKTAAFASRWTAMPY